MYCSENEKDDRIVVGLSYRCLALEAATNDSTPKVLTGGTIDDILLDHFAGRYYFAQQSVTQISLAAKAVVRLPHHRLDQGHGGHRSLW